MSYRFHMFRGNKFRAMTCHNTPCPRVHAMSRPPCRYSVFVILRSLLIFLGGYDLSILGVKCPRQNVHGKMFTAKHSRQNEPGKCSRQMFTANIWISIKHNYLHLNHNILDFGDLGEAWHAIWTWHRRRCPDQMACQASPSSQTPKYVDSYVNNCVLWISQFV